MRPVLFKLPPFVFDALRSQACGFYGNYIFFLFRDRYGFGDLGNLGVAALMGLVIAVASCTAGKLAQRRGCIPSIFVVLFGMMMALAIGAHLLSLPVQLAGYLLLMAGFAIVLTAGDLIWLSLGRVAFGLAAGLLYYAYFFYSMDVGKARAEQGGIHEAMMGAGNLVGPGIGALGLIIAPQLPHAGVWTVSGFLAIGMAVLLGTRLLNSRSVVRVISNP